LDVFLAAQKVGPNGRAIGIDMTAEMIERARRGAQKLGYTNVEFHLATIDQLPLPSSSVDCVISNCVINLAPDKAAVFREIFRVLKPGGRVAISDIALKRELPAELARSVAAYVGCISGAISIEEYARLLQIAGFDQVQIEDQRHDLNAYSLIEGQAGCCSPNMGGACCGSESEVEPIHEGLSRLMKQFDVNEYAASVGITARKSLVLTQE
jgi:SAM-dependent methyltransferase